MVERLESVITWRWIGPVLVGVIVMMLGAWAVHTNSRIMRLEDIVASIDKQNIAQNGQYDMILARLNILSSRVETLVQQHVIQEGVNSNRWRP